MANIDTPGFGRRSSGASSDPDETDWQQKKKPFQEMSRRPRQPGTLGRKFFGPLPTVREPMELEAVGARCEADGFPVASTIELYGFLFKEKFTDLFSP